MMNFLFNLLVSTTVLIIVIMNDLLLKTKVELVSSLGIYRWLIVSTSLATPTSLNLW